MAAPSYVLAEPAQKPGRKRGSWLRNFQAQRLRAKRNGMSLRTQLMLLLGILVVVATISLGSIAYKTSRALVERAAVREVGTIATFRKQLLVQILLQQRIRADAVMKTAEVGCSHDETWCLRQILLDFVASEGASAAHLTYRGFQPALVGKGAIDLGKVAALPEGQLARFAFDGKNNPYYLLQVTSSDGRAVLTMRGNMQVANQLFMDRYGLGQSGETFLADNRGYFLTTPKYETKNGESQPMGGEPMRLCLAGNEGQMLAPSYRGVPVVYGFRSVPEIGGGCIMTLIDQTEAFAPTRGIEQEVGRVSGLLSLMAIVCSLLVTHLVSRPMKRLTGRARSLQRGDFDSPFPVEGPSEVRTFAQTFEAMAISLKRSRAALEESNEQVRNLLESISDGFAAFDRQWRCTYVNDKAVELCHISRTDLLGQNPWKLLPALTGSKAFAELQKSMDQGAPVHLEEFDPRYDIWFEIDAYPTRDGLAVFGRDVTERKQFNARLQQTQRLESLGLLAGGIAHDFNNLLTGIIGNASMAVDEVPTDSFARKCMDAVVAAGERAGALTRQLLAYAGKGRFVVTRLNLSDQVREISDLLRTSIPRNVQIELDLQENLPSIEGDAAQIQQLIMNLVINAAESVEPGKPETVAVRTKLERIDQSYASQTLPPGSVSPDSYVTIEVRDQGCGMSEETLSKIFDPFFTTKFTGRGLGLAAAMGIVRGHKAALKVESAVGSGSTFKVLFPVCGGAPQLRPVAIGAEDLKGSGLILVVDDEPAVRNAARTALESYGYRVEAAENGKEGVEAVEKLGSEITAVLLDVTMPLMSGEEAFVRMRNLRPDMPIILSSGYDESEATRQFTGKDLAGFLQKPYTAPQLASKIKSILKNLG